MESLRWVQYSLSWLCRRRLRDFVRCLILRYQFLRVWVNFSREYPWYCYRIQQQLHWGWHWKQIQCISFLVDLINIKQQRLFGGFEECFIIWDLDDLIPLIETHDSESVSLFALLFSINFEVGEWHNFFNLSYSNTDLFGGHDLVPFKVVVFLHIKFLYCL